MVLCVTSSATRYLLVLAKGPCRSLEFHSTAIFEEDALGSSTGCAVHSGVQDLARMVFQFYRERVA